MLNLYLGSFKLGVSATFVYQLLSPYPDNGSDTQYGLFRLDNSPKPVATAIHNMTTILSDAASAGFQAGQLDYSLSGMPASGKSMLLEKSTGVFDLAVWAEPVDWNNSTHSEVVVAPSTVTLSLGKTFTTVNVYDPTKGATPIQTLSNASTVQLAITDHPLIVEMSATTSGGGSLPPPPAPAPVTTGSGSDTLVLTMSEDAYQGDAQFTVAIDGKQIGGTFTTTASHASGVSQSFTFKGDWGVGAHAVAVNFINDLYNGTTATDRNLYVNSVSYDGTNTSQSAALMSGGSKNFSVTDATAIPSVAPAPVTTGTVTTGTGSDALVLTMSEDAYQGDAHFTVAVDGKQLAGIFTASASHAAGASQNFTFNGNWGVGTHAVAVNFLNDAYAGTTATDRNLYVNAISYDGKATGQSAALMSAGSKGFSVTDSTAIPSPAIGSGADTLVLKVSEDAYQGDAQFTVAIDGKQLGGNFTTTASHASGASQSFTFKGDFGTGAHTLAVNFLNDAWAGAGADRNLYLDGVSYLGTSTGQSAAFYGTGPQSFAISGGTTPAVSETSDHGSLAKNLAQTGTYTVGGDTFVLSSGNAAAVTLGTGASQIKFIGASSLALTGGAGQAVVSADAGNNRFTAGAGSLEVTGGGGKDAYVFHANGGLLTIDDFSAAKGDTLTVDKALQGAFTQTSDLHGGVMLGFGTAGHGVDIHGLAAMPSTNIVWA
jgi:hypothetical protein